MVAFIRDLGNKFFSTPTMTLLQAFKLPTMSYSNNIGMDIFVESSPNNCNEVRDRTLSTKEQISRNFSMSSTKLSITYYIRMEHKNTMNKDIEIDDSP